MIASVISAGFQTTVQDCGRFGFRKFGAPISGALDSHSLRLANLLVGNETGAAGLEIVSGRVRLRFDDERLLAWSGGDFLVRIGKDEIPRLHCAQIAAGEICEIEARHGRLWLAISGGIDLPQVLGSRATDLRAGFGGFGGRALRDGDRLPLGTEGGVSVRMRKSIAGRVSSWSASLPAPRDPILRIVRGRNWNEFAPPAQEQFCAQTFRVAMESDRMGLRLEGPALASQLANDLVSEAVTPGTIQVPPGGQPIILLTDCQTIGGYPKVAHVITIDLAAAAQRMPGDEVRFEITSVQNARRLLLTRERDLALFRAGLEARFG